MKNGVVLMLMLVCGISGFSQTKKQCLDSIVKPVSEKYLFSYDNKGNNILGISYHYNLQNKTWNGYQKREYTYDEKGNKTLAIIGSGNTWSKSWKVEYAYNANRNLTSEIQYYRNDIWVESSKYEYTYNLSYSKTDLIFPPDYPMNTMRTEKNTYSWSGTDWWNHWVITYYWSEQKTTGIEQLTTNNEQLIIYPNPTNNKFFVECENGNTIKLYNMLGQNVVTQTANGKTKININHLPKGVYSVRVFSADRVIGNSKIIKQ